MSVDSTNRICNPVIARKVAIRLAVEAYDRKMNSKHRKARSFIGLTTPLVKCSQCNRSMRKDIADKQIENLRENAPICVACCVGYARKPLSEVIAANKNNIVMTPETLRKLKEFKKRKIEYARVSKLMNNNYGYYD